jgi:hypothetical protein
MKEESGRFYPTNYWLRISLLCGQSEGHGSEKDVRCVGNSVNVVVVRCVMQVPFS